MPLILKRALARARDRRGFTLVETLVAMVTGIIVTGALFTILEVSAKQTARVSEVAQATQSGRTAMTHIVDELHSACLSAGFAPVKAGSGESKLVFVNAYFPAKSNEATEPEYGFVRKDEIEYVSAKGTLTDTKSQATAEPTAKEYPWKSLGTTKLAENISQTESAPVFTYYKYSTASSTGTNEAAATLTKMASSEVTSTPGNIAAVGIAFRAGYSGKKEVKLTSAAEKGLVTDQSTLTTFALGSPNSESVIQAGPCE
jgi:Tfp pilus assembly protein PilW